MAVEGGTRGGQLRASGKQAQAGKSGRKLLVAIGIDAYRHLPPLQNATNDARSVARLFAEQLGYEVPVEPLLNGQATAAAINTLVVDHLRQVLQPEDTLVLFFAGHGAVRADERGGSVGFLAPVEAEPEQWSSYLRIDTLLDEIGRLPALHILVIFDTCFSGYALGGTFARQVQAGQSGRRASRRVLTSARAEQLAQDGSSRQLNSPFTAILLDAFTRQDNGIALADFDQNGTIIGIELGLFVQLEFGKRWQYEQMPDFGTFHHDERGEFALDSRGMARRPDDPKLLEILRDAQVWLRNRGDRAYLYRGSQLAQALAWRAQKAEADVREEVDTFLNAARQWRTLRRLAAAGTALALLILLYVAGLTLYRARLRSSARAETVTFPARTVRLGVAGAPFRIPASFKLDVHEVSAEQYRLCFRARACDEPVGIPAYEALALTAASGQVPVVAVSALNARDYCAWQGGRLPTAAEWEYAVRATSYRPWPWGEDVPTRAHVNINLFNTANPAPFTDRLVAVQSPAYAAGVTDEGVWHLLGNAREWTSTLVPGCPHDGQGTFSDVHECATWDGSDAVSGLFAAGLSYRDDLVPKDEHRVSEFLNLTATAHRQDLGFRCAYDLD